jgi:hypothetical protein
LGEICVMPCNIRRLESFIKRMLRIPHLQNISFKLIQNIVNVMPWTSKS